MSKRQRHIHVNSNEHVVVHYHGRRRSQAHTNAGGNSPTLEQIICSILHVANHCLEAAIGFILNFVQLADSGNKRRRR